MPVKIVIAAYLTVTLGFALLFRYGFYYSFDIDTGYLGPFLLFHAFQMVSPSRIKVNNENNSI